MSSSGSSASNRIFWRCKRRRSKTRNSRPTRSSQYGYDATFSGQSAYNGVAILSRAPPSAICFDIGGGYVDEQKRVLGATFGGLRLWSLYVPNGQSVDSDKYRYKLELARGVARAARRRARAPPATCCSSATSTSRPTIETSIIPPRGTARSCARRPSARRSRTSASWGSAIRSGCFRSPRRCSAGGTIAPARFGATKGFESTSLSPRQH